MPEVFKPKKNVSLKDLRTLPRWLQIFVGLSIVLGALPFLADVFHYQYFPVPDWLDLASYVAWGVAVVTAATFAFAVWRNRDAYLGGFRRTATVTFVAFFLGLAVGWHAVTHGGPMVIAAFGKTVEVPYTVISADKFGSRSCRNPIELDLGAVFFDRLCRFSDEFRVTLSPGDTIILSGRGTAMGVFASSARKLE